jgi:acetyl esterase/lipase
MNDLVLEPKARGRYLYSACLALLLAGSPGCSRSALPFDSGSSDASTCPDLLVANIWEDRLGSHTLADRCAILGCAHAATFTQAEVAQSPLFPKGIGPATNGYELLVLQYVSEGRPGVARAVTALVYLPTGGATDVPLAVVDHAASGIGPTCGPSHVPLVTDPMAVPLVGRGYAVVAPDYAGMGVDNGMTSYFVGKAEAAATLDAVRALRRLHAPHFEAAQLARDLFLVGHSQGGHAALFAHQLFDPSVGFTLRGTVAFAPGLGSARDWATLFQGAARPVSGPETFAAMSLYTRMLYDGGPAPGTWLSPAAQSALPKVFHDQCMPMLPAYVHAGFPTVGDLYQPSFLASAAACTFKDACPGFEPWASAFIAEQPGNFTSDVPALLLQGLADTLVAPATSSCIVDRLRAHGTPVQACAYAGDDHLSILGSAAPAMVHWMAARRTGATPDVCPAQLKIPCDLP